MRANQLFRPLYRQYAVVFSGWGLHRQLVSEQRLHLARGHVLLHENSGGLSLCEAHARFRVNAVFLIYILSGSLAGDLPSRDDLRDWRPFSD